MKILESILKRPIFSGVFYVSSIGALLLIYSIYNVSLRRDQVGFEINAVPLNFLFTLFSLGLTLLPAVAVRLFAFEIAWRKFGHRAALATALIIFELMGMLMILNFYMNSITNGGIGSVALVIVSLVNLLGAVVWGIIAAGLWFSTRTRVDLPPADVENLRKY